MAHTSWKNISFALLALLALATPAWAVGGAVTVATTAGGTALVPAGDGHVLIVQNIGGSNVVDCAITGNGTVTASNWNFHLAATGAGATWTAPTMVYSPDLIGSPHIMGAEGITCIAISGSSVVTWYRE